MTTRELEILENWLADKSFINWANGTNAGDIAKWDHFLQESPEYKELAELAKTSIVKLQVKPTLKEVNRSNAALKKLEHTIANKQAKQQSTSKRISLFPFIGKVAASLLLLIGFAGLIYVSTKSADEIVVIAQSGVEHIELSDGTEVALRENSILKYKEGVPRHVELEGEAYFKVSKRYTTGEQFQVKTKDLTVVVLGTAFNVDTKNTQTAVFLDEGKVNLQLRDEKHSLIDMQPGELVAFSSQKQQTLVHEKAPSLAHTSWKEHTIVFDKTPLAVVIQAIEDVYHINCTVDKNITEMDRFTGGFPTQDLSIALHTLEGLFQLEITVDDKNYHFRKVD